MIFLIWLVIGGVITGWVASILMGIEDPKGIFLNVVVSIVGVALGSWLFGSAFGSPTIYPGNLSANGITVSLICAAILIVTLKLLRRV